MEKIPFTKMAGSGNDFIIIDNRKLLLDKETLSKLATKACARRVSVGADGILVVENSDATDFKMRLFNKDGSEGEMCGNGARCIARYAFEEGIAPQIMVFETLAGEIHGEVNGSRVRIKMGDIQIENIQRNAVVKTTKGDFTYSYLILGVPHGVIFIDENNFNEEWVTELGRELRYRTDVFPRGVNVNFVLPVSPDEIKVLTYERGVEEVTLACGTGSTASSLITHMEKGYSSPLDVVTKGGTLKVYFNVDHNKYTNIYLEGDASNIVKGEIIEEAWNW